MRVTKRTVATACAAALLGSGALLAASPADAYPGQLCNARSNGAPFFATPGGGDWVYTVPPGGGIRDDGGEYYAAGQWYHSGHGDGHTTAWFRLADSTCS